MKIKLLKEVKTIGGDIVPAGTIYENTKNNPGLFISQTGYKFAVGFNWKKGVEIEKNKGTFKVI